MPNFLWAIVGGLAAAAGGAVSNWLVVVTGVMPAKPEETARIVAIGAVVAGLTGSVISLGRGGRPGWASWVYTALVAAAGVAAGPFLCLLFVAWMFALLGGLVALAVTWVLLWLAGVRPAGTTGPLTHPLIRRPRSS
jgi:hypothetical protein